MRKEFDLVREVFPKEVLMGLRAGGVGVNQVEMGGNCIPGGGNSMNRSPEVAGTW